MKRHHFRRLIAACLTIYALTNAAASTDAASTITWRRCETIPDAVEAFLGDRLECGSMISPANNAAPESAMHSQSIVVGLVRVKAGKPSERQGAIFVNFGGPGESPLEGVPMLAYQASMRRTGTSGAEDMRRLTDRYDFIGVIPRGLPGGTQAPCHESATSDPVAAAGNDEQWMRVVESHKRAADGCQHWLMPFIGTQNHVGDMEQARRALGEPALHFLGYSYGAWVGAAYAATFPQFTGRMVLDSSMNYAATIEDQLHDEKWEQQVLFHRLVLHPAASNERYGLGSDAEAILERFRQMPEQTIYDWAGAIGTPESLAAALVMSDWVRADDSMTRTRLEALIKNHTFSTAEDLDADIRTAAEHLAGMFRRQTRTGSATYMGTTCGDTPWHRHLGYIRSAALSHAALYPASPSMDVTLGLLCRNLPAPAARRPSLEALAGATPLLMVQTEFDATTPLALARKAFVATPGAYMVVARAATEHGLSGMSVNSCIDRVVARYLLEGTLPRKRFSTCDVDPPTEANRSERNVPGDRSENEGIRSRLRALLSKS